MGSPKTNSGWMAKNKHQACSFHIFLLKYFASMSAIWRVLGGGDKGGIVVRNGSSLSSTQDVLRLETGALVQEAGGAAVMKTLVG